MIKLAWTLDNGRIAQEEQLKKMTILSAQNLAKLKDVTDALRASEAKYSQHKQHMENIKLNISSSLDDVLQLTEKAKVEVVKNPLLMSVLAGGN